MTATDVKGDPLTMRARSTSVGSSTSSASAPTRRSEPPASMTTWSPRCGPPASTGSSFPRRWAASRHRRAIAWRRSSRSRPPTAAPDGPRRSASARTCSPGYVHRDAAAEIFADLDSSNASMFAPLGNAVAGRRRRVAPHRQVAIHEQLPARVVDRRRRVLPRRGRRSDGSRASGGVRPALGGAGARHLGRHGDARDGEPSHVGRRCRRRSGVLACVRRTVMGGRAAVAAADVHRPGAVPGRRVPRDRPRRARRDRPSSAGGTGERCGPR